MQLPDPRSAGGHTNKFEMQFFSTFPTFSWLMTVIFEFRG